MAYEELADLSADVTTGLGGKNKKTGKNNPTKVEGYYLGSRQVQGKKGISTLHVFLTADGKVGIWGKKDSNDQLARVKPGIMTEISYDRMVPTPNGDMYKYKVRVDKTNKIEVAGIEPGNAAAYDGGDETTDYGDGGSDEDTELQDTAAAEEAAKARREKVNALLNRNKRA